MSVSARGAVDERSGVKTTCTKHGVVGTVELIDLAEFKVDLQPGEFLLIEFRYDIVR